MEAVPWKKGTGQGLKNHVKNHLDCIAKRNPKTNANVDIAAHIAKFSAVWEILHTEQVKNWYGMVQNLQTIMMQTITLFQITGNHGNFPGFK